MSRAPKKPAKKTDFPHGLGVNEFRRQVLQTATCTGSARTLLAILLQEMDWQRPQVRASRKLLAGLLGLVDLGTVRRLLRQLENSGQIIRLDDGQGGRGNVGVWTIRLVGKPLTSDEWSTILATKYGREFPTPANDAQKIGDNPDDTKGVQIGPERGANRPGKGGTDAPPNHVSIDTIDGPDPSGAGTVDKIAAERGELERVTQDLSPDERRFYQALIDTGEYELAATALNQHRGILQRKRNEDRRTGLSGHRTERGAGW